MNTKLIIWILGIFFGAIVVGIVWYFIFAPKTVSQPPPTSVTLPSSGSVIPGSATEPGSTTSGTMSLGAQNGTVIVAKDFIHNGATISDTANTGRYLLAGNLEYCLSNPQQCQAAQATNFKIYYESVPQAFTIALTEEPIGQARLDAEQFMLITLGLTQQQMCSLHYYVGTTYWVNERYDDRNLGFSFCPGATVLPK